MSYIRIKWNDTNSIEEGYKIYRSTSPIDPLSPPPPLATVGANVKEYVDTTAVEGTTYYYRVAAYLATIVQFGAQITVVAGPEPSAAKVMLSVGDEVDEGLNNNLLLSGDANTGSDLLLM